MSYSCKILLDSISPTGKRITTFEITFPRIVLAEFNTHRMFSRNSASSRAIPFKKRIQEIVDNPFIPEKFPIDGKGMQPNSYIANIDEYYGYMVEKWMEARDLALDSACKLYSAMDSDYNLAAFERGGIYRDWDWQNDEKPQPAIHKQLVNRLLEPFMWHTVIVTATEFDNFFKLRTHPDAQYEIRRIADLMYEAYHAFDDRTLDHEPYILEDNFSNWQAIQPQKLNIGEWHCPLVYEDDEYLINEYVTNPKNLFFDLLSNLDIQLEMKKRISVARCARVSYLTHDGKRDIEADLNLYERLKNSGHYSPFEHIATPYFLENMYLDEQLKGSTDGRLSEGFNYSSDLKYLNLRSGNFIGWKQARKDLLSENCTSFRKE